MCARHLCVLVHPMDGVLSLSGDWRPTMHAYLQSARTLIEKTTEGITPEELRRHPPGKWCAAEILEHLSRAYSSTLKLLERQLESGKPPQRRPTAAERRRALVVIEIGFLPKGRQAPEFTLPQGLPADEALPRFFASLDAMDDSLNRCQTHFGTSQPIAEHAIFGPLTVRRWRRFHWVHTRHHARQIQRLRSEGK